MREYSPGASVHDDFAYGCDNCERLDGRPVLVWRAKDLPGENRDHFSICFECLSKLYFQYVVETEKVRESVVVKRAIIHESLRNEVHERDGHKCVLCGSRDDLTIDHILPFSKGGKTKKENFQTLCKTCNLKKGASI